MTDPQGTIFTSEEKERLILAHLHGRKGEPVSVEDIEAFVEACEAAVVTGECVRMAADGDLFIEWDQATGAFAFGLSEQGERRAMETLT